ncbi:MAG TPA: hypothetical protein DEP82_01025 [Arthrobacter bacterium]|jgi:hypothetical protein|nr:hypothetical protein [Arthrobacter sp.]HCB56549.1 hypothetical protein [Arthrobacter sp.]HCC40095.1 hypothetical protein [Arthrobacter sp.]
MTTRHTPHDEQIIDELLLETGRDDAQELKAALLDLRCFADGPPVVPSRELAALMATGPVSLDARRQSKHRRTALTALAIAASMGIGTAAVAATDPGFREKAQQAITTVVEAVTHGHSGRPAPAPARDPDLPAPAQGTPGRSGTNPGSPPVTPPAVGTANVPSPPAQQDTGNRPSTSSQHSSPHS